MRLARYGFPQVGVALAASLAGLAAGTALALSHSPWWWALAAVSGLACLFVLWFFRDPARAIPQEDGLLVSPADGVVTHIDEEDEPAFIGGRAKRLSIFLSVFDAHLNRAPCAGTVSHMAYHPGKFADARDDASHAGNERQDLGLDTGDPRCPKVLVRQIAGFIARRIVCPRTLGERLERGQTYGMIKFGSRTTLCLPADAAAAWVVGVGDRVKAGETVLARLGEGGSLAESAQEGS